MKLAAATAVALIMIAAPALAAPPTAGTSCVLKALPPNGQQEAILFLGSENHGQPPATVPGNFGGLNTYARDAGFQNAAQAAKSFGVSPSEVNQVLHHCRNPS